MLMKLSNYFGSQKWVRDTRNGDQPLFLLGPGGQPRISCYPELSGRSSELAVKAASVRTSHSVHLITIYLIRSSGFIFQSADPRCRPDVGCNPGSRRGKIKYFTVGGFAIKLRAHEGGWGGIQTQPSTFEILQNWSRSLCKKQPVPHLYLHSFLFGIFIEIFARCQELWFQSGQLTRAREVTRQAMRNGRRIGIITLIYLNCILSLAIALRMFLLVDWESPGDDDDDI